MDISNFVIHASPDVRGWAETITISRLTMRPGKDEGLSFEFEPRHKWPDYTPPGWDGPIQYTVWPVVSVGGQWHTAGIIQMWRNRPSTGAPLLTQWTDWCYDPNRWGVMVNYRPKVGDKVGFFLTAGNARKGSAGTEPDVTSVAERSNVVWVELPPGDQGVFTFNDSPTPSPLPVPSPPPPVPPPAVGGCGCGEALKEIKLLLEELLTRPTPSYVGRVNYPNVSLWPEGKK